MSKCLQLSEKASIPVGSWPRDFIFAENAGIPGTAVVNIVLRQLLAFSSFRHTKTSTLLIRQ